MDISKMAPEPETPKKTKHATNSAENGAEINEPELKADDNPEKEVTSPQTDRDDIDSDLITDETKTLLDSSDSGHVTDDSTPVKQGSGDHVITDCGQASQDASREEKDKDDVDEDDVSPNTIEENEQEVHTPEVLITDDHVSDNISFFDEPTPPVPPDGGYGWVIVACGFMVNLLVDGMCYMGGVLYIDLLEYFEEPKGKTQWVHTLVPAVYLMTGPFVGALVNKYGCRLITIIGSLIAGTFFVVSALVPSIEALIFTYGVMIGIGFGLMYLPAVCFVSYYFDRRRAMATGIAVCGSGIGTFIFPPFMNYILSMYGWRGSLLILSGLSLNCCVFGALMRPLVATKPKPKKLEDERECRKQSRKEKKQQKELEQQRSIIMQKIIEQKKRQRTVSNGSLDGTVITSNNQLVKDPALLKMILHNETRTKLQNSAVLNVSAPDLRREVKPRTFSNISEMSVSLQTSRTDLDEEKEIPESIAPHLINKHLQNVTGVRRRDASESSHVGSHRSLHHGSAIGSVESLKRKQKDMGRVMYRQDIFYTGSITSIAEFKSNPDLNHYNQSVISIPPSDTATGNCAPFTNVINQMFDLSLFKSVTFIVLISNAFFSFLGFFVPFMFIPDLAKIMGASGGEAAFLISVLGLCNTFARLAAGWLADRPWADCLVIQNVALILGGVATAMVPLFTTYGLLVAYCCVFGSCMAMFIALRSIVTAEMMGVNKLNNAFGLTIFFQGVAGTAGAPLAGTIFDATGSYTVSFIIAGSFIAFSGAICLPLRRISQWENSKQPEMDAEYHMVAADEFNLPLPAPDGTDSKGTLSGSGKEVRFVTDVNPDIHNEGSSD